MLKIYRYVKHIINMKLRNLSYPSKKFFSSKLNLDALDGFEMDGLDGLESFQALRFKQFAAVGNVWSQSYFSC